MPQGWMIRREDSRVLAGAWCFVRVAMLCCVVLVALGMRGVAGAQEPTPPPPQADARPTERSSAAPPSPAPAPAPTVPAFRKASNVAIIPIIGEIDGGGRLGNSVMVASVDRRIRAAIRSGADALVFEIDSPGGEVNASLRIASLIKDAPVKNTVAWVRGQALSGGAIIALAAREIVIADPVKFGDAMPIQMTPQGPRAVRDPELLKKVLPPLLTEVLDSARRHNAEFGAYQRDEFLLTAIVANDVPLWWVRNKASGQYLAIDTAEFAMLFPGQDPSAGGPTRLASTGIAPIGRPSQGRPTRVDGLPAGSSKIDQVVGDVAADAATLRASTRPRLTPQQAGEWELVERITDGTAPATFSASDMAFFNLAANATRGVDGRVMLEPIESDEQVQAFFGAQYVGRLSPGWSDSLVLFLTNPWVRMGLIVIFLLSLFGEMSHPGAIVPGVVSLVALIALIAPPALIGMANWLEIAAIGLGLALIALEVFVIPGFGVAGISGLVLLLVGLVGTFLPAGFNPLSGNNPGDSAALAWALGIVVASLFTAGVGIFFLAKHLGSVPVVGALVHKQAPDAEALTTVGTQAPALELAALARVGEQGLTLTPMHPSGRVELDAGDTAGEPPRVVDAVSEFGFLKAGERVRVVSVDGVRIAVERMQA